MRGIKGGNDVKLAFLYAGQGSQTVGMGKDLYKQFADTRAVFDTIKLDFDVKKCCFEGPMELLSQTQYTQPCMVAFAIAVTRLLAEQSIVPQMVAGLSLGEYSALYAAGVLDLQTALSLVRYRGQVMEEAVAGVQSKMIAVLGLEREQVHQAVAQGSALGLVQAANYNCPGQIVIGGEIAAVDKAAECALELGAKRTMELNVSGPFHTSLLEPAAQKLAKRLEQIQFGHMRVPVVFNTTARELQPNETVAQLLMRQVMSPVYLEDSIRYMLEQGVDTFVEIGPGKVLSGFVKKITKDVAVYQAQDVASLQATINQIKG